MRNAKIPRGSIYQYFEDKQDLYFYIFDIIAAKKLEYIGEFLKNPQGIPFLDLFREMYVSGLKFALDNPKFVKIFKYLMSTRGEVYDKLISTNLDMAINLYKMLIEADKEKGRIRQDVDSEVFAKLVIDLTMNVSVEEIALGKEMNYDNMFKRITQLIDIIEKGVTKGELDV